MSITPIPTQIWMHNELLHKIHHTTNKTVLCVYQKGIRHLEVVWPLLYGVLWSEDCPWSRCTFLTFDFRVNSQKRGKSMHKMYYWYSTHRLLSPFIRVRISEYEINLELEKHLVPHSGLPPPSLPLILLPPPLLPPLARSPFAAWLDTMILLPLHRWVRRTRAARDRRPSPGTRRRNPINFSVFAPMGSHDGAVAVAGREAKDTRHRLVIITKQAVRVGPQQILWWAETLNSRPIWPGLCCISVSKV